MPNLREDHRRNLFETPPDPLPPEPTPRTQARWKDRPAKVYKYVDDAIISDRICMENAHRYEDEETAVREKLAVQTQNLFRRVTGKAEWKGMKVNTGKTKMLCISDALSFVPGSYIRPSEGSDKISSGGREDSMKLLGFRVSNCPGVAAHIEAVRKKFRQRFWVLIHLRTFGFTEKELVKVYTTILRPVAEYCAPVYHSQMTDEQEGPEEPPFLPLVPPEESRKIHESHY